MGDNILTKYTVQEKLNKMDVEVFEFTPTTYASSAGDNTVIFSSHEIEEAMMEDGGRGIIQSITILDDDDHGGAMDIFVHTRAGAIGSEGGAISSTSSADLESIKGVFSVSTYTDGVNWKLGHKENIGLVVNSTSSSRSIFITAVNRSGGALTYTASGLIVRVGIIRD